MEKINIDIPADAKVVTLELAKSRGGPVTLGAALKAVWPRTLVRVVVQVRKHKDDSEPAGTLEIPLCGGEGGCKTLELIYPNLLDKPVTLDVEGGCRSEYGHKVDLVRPFIKLIVTEVLS